MKTLTILIGNIGSGKTTWISKNRKSNDLVISRDALRYMFGGGKYLFDPVNSEPQVASITEEMVEILCCDGKNIILDETNMNRKMREKYIYLAKICDYKIIAVVLPKYSKIISVNRRMKNPHGQYDRKIWDSVWQRFDDMYEAPTKKEGFVVIRKLKK